VRGNFHPLHIAMWGLVGGSFTILDELHIHAGITRHENNVIAQKFPAFFSPNYAAGGIAFYLLYVTILGIPFAGKNMSRSIIGGHSISWGLFTFEWIKFSLSYLITTLLGGYGNEHTFLPFITPVLLLLLASPNLLKMYRISARHHPEYIFIRFLIFILAVMCTGTAAEWLLCSSGNMFSYGVCPSVSCLGAKVALSWLPFLYMSAAIFVHSVLQNTCWLEQHLLESSKKS